MPACCNKCAKTTSTPINFLLTCCSCSSSWHHRCHSPVVGDQELIARIKATNARDARNDIAAWKCATCILPPAPTVIDLTASSDDESLQAPILITIPNNHAPFPNSQAPAPKPSHNLATAWIRQRHSAPDTSLRSWKTSCSRKPATPTKPPNRDRFYFSASKWLQERARSDPK